MKRAVTVIQVRVQKEGSSSRSKLFDVCVVILMYVLVFLCPKLNEPGFHPLGRVNVPRTGRF